MNDILGIITRLIIFNRDENESFKIVSEIFLKIFLETVKLSKQRLKTEIISV
ncbi:hypothetical protein ACTS91_04240 [Empedobacter falsenii]|uniref:hypothetical protein n=1 Tax=Empedobacter falsenii TaxID=343874 RepID=UPI001C880669|nr:hypothetical protein [Empedobacter falsenii]